MWKLLEGDEAKKALMNPKITVTYFPENGKWVGPYIWVI